MTDIFKQLARRLDEMPNGYPATPSGVELRLLRKIFRPEEARMALQLKDKPERLERIAVRLNKPVPLLKEMLDYMYDKGQISRIKVFGEDRYLLMPFIVGIYEYQLNRLDKEMADLFEAYAPTLLRAVGGAAPALTRVVPVDKRIDARLDILPYESVQGIIERAKSFSVRMCICRWENEIQGAPCRHPMETCLEFSYEENAFDTTSFGRPIDRAEAIEILNAAEEHGLVHTTYNVASGNIFVCNCCSCCCGLIRGLKEYNAPHLIARSNFIAAIDPELCVGCGSCAGDRCPVDAITKMNKRFTVQTGKCIGCGVCTAVCRVQAITLIRRSTTEQNLPTKNLLDWRIKRAKSRLHKCE